MPNGWYERGRTAQLKGEDSNGTRLSLKNDNIKFVLVNFFVSGHEYGKAVSGANTSNPLQVTATGHGYTTGDIVLIAGVGGQTKANGIFEIVVTGSNTFTLKNADDGTAIDGSTGGGSYTSGGNTVNLSVHEFLSDIDTLAIAATSSNLASKTFNTPRGGVFDAADGALGTVAAGPVCQALITYKDTGSTATSPLLWIHTDALGLPITPNGTPETVPWDNGRQRILMI